MNNLLEIELPDTFVCSNCGELPIDRFTEGVVKNRIRDNRKTTYCIECYKLRSKLYYENGYSEKHKKLRDIKYQNRVFLSQKYLLPNSWFQTPNKGIEYGLVSTLASASNKRGAIDKIKSKELWLYYCCHVYLNNRTCAYSGKEFQYFYSDNMTHVLNEYMPSLDHIVPIDNFGENTISNVTFITYNFNLRKGKTSLQSYYEKLISDNGLPLNAKPDVDGILAQINNTYQFYLKHRGTAKMHDIEQYVLETSPYKHIENEIKGLDLDMGY